ncbi:hypothetical protein [Bradyrhizobium sp. RT5a]|uniref:hypothetical protein n=1 Tax=Bradyrhizobium sp. RT5a TaxID=3156380 RepID=UPI00339B9E2A
MKESTLRVYCYGVVPGAPLGERIGIFTRGERGHQAVDFDSAHSDGRFMTAAQAKDLVFLMNRQLGVDPGEAERIIRAALGPLLTVVPKP